ncbi:MAG: hypothetical protein HZA30_04570 [Candidatus Omnitrophica bacterium]|nr:hypothetical protein [Candidatus Omnitrophota bacterium]
MRHTRARRRLKLILITLLSVTVLIFFETRLESFAPRLKDYAELKIEEAFGETFKVSIGSLVGGIFHPLALNDCIIKDPGGNTLFQAVNIDNIVTEYRIWDLFKRKKDSATPATGRPHIDIQYSSRDKTIFGFARLEGDIENAKAKGYINLFGREKIDYTGNIKKGSSFELELKPKNGTVNVEGAVSSDGNLAMDVKLSHFRLYGFDIVCETTIKNKFFGGSGDSNTGWLEGEAATKNLILNYKPFSNLKASYKISKGMLEISNLEVGKDFTIYGNVGIKEPHSIDIVIMANNANLSWLFSVMHPQSAGYLTGTMNGKFKLTGTFANPRLNARFDVRQGKLADVDFKHLNASLKGEGPIIRIEDSRITRESGYFVLGGEIDLSKAGSGSMFERVKIASSDAAIIWDGWDTMKMRDIQELRMKKRMSEEVDLSFKKYIADARIDESVRDTDQYELEYNLNPNENLKFRLGQDRDFFGLEHKDRF